MYESDYLTTNIIMITLTATNITVVLVTATSSFLNSGLSVHLLYVVLIRFMEYV